jgi:tetratricopeptide (TPR) repeat protein
MNTIPLSLKPSSLTPWSLVALCILTGCASIKPLAGKDTPSEASPGTRVGFSNEAQYRFSTSSNADELYRLGRGALQSGYEAQAMTLFKAALKIDPHHSDARNGMAVILHSRNQNEEALELIRLALERDPGSELLLRNQARVKEAIAAKGGGAPTQASQVVEPLPALKADRLPVSQSFTALNNATSSFVLVQVQPNVYELQANPRLIVEKQAQAVQVLKAPEAEPVQALSTVELSASTSAPKKEVISPVQNPVTGINTRAFKPVMAVRTPKTVNESSRRPKKEATEFQGSKVLISNGKGERGLACREAKDLMMQGWRTPGCLDHTNFSQKRSVIYFVAGREEAAKQIRHSLLQTHDIELRRVNTLRKNADVQILIGHDWSKVRVPLRPKS